MCETNQYTEHEHCTAYQLVPFAFIKIAKFFDFAGAAVTALATVAIAWFTWTLKRSTDRLWDAGERQLKHLEGTSERQLRAYVGVFICNIRNFGIETQITGRLAIKNTGQTPAYDLNMRTAIVAGDVPCSDFPLPSFETPEIGTLPAGEHMTVFAAGNDPIVLSRSQVEKIRTEKAAIWIWGDIQYRDVFGSSRQTTFRLVYTGNVATDPPGGMRFDTGGNTAN